MTWQKWLIRFLRIGFGVMLIVASMDKIQHPSEFAEVVENYRVLGEGLSRWVAVWLPYLEIITGLLLILGVWLDVTILLNGLLMCTFFIWVSQAYIRGLDIQCGCFFVEGEATIGVSKILENTLFVGFAFLLLGLKVNAGKGQLKTSKSNRHIEG